MPFSSEGVTGHEVRQEVGALEPGQLRHTGSRAVVQLTIILLGNFNLPHMAHDDPIFSVWKRFGDSVASSHHQMDGRIMKFISVSDYSGILECELFVSVPPGTTMQ